MPSLVLEATWAAAGGSIIIYLAALLVGARPSCTTRPRSTVPASGARSGTSRVPQLRGILFIMLILQVIATAQVFLEPFLFTGGGAGRRDARRSCCTSTTKRSATAWAATTARRPRCRCCSRSCSGSSSVALLPAHQPLEHHMTHHDHRRADQGGHARIPPRAAASATVDRRPDVDRTIVSGPSAAGPARDSG